MTAPLAMATALHSQLVHELSSNGGFASPIQVDPTTSKVLAYMMPTSHYGCHLPTLLRFDNIILDHASIAEGFSARKRRLFSQGARSNKLSVCEIGDTLYFCGLR